MMPISARSGRPSCCSRRGSGSRSRPTCARAIMDASPLKRALYEFGMARGLDALDEGGRPLAAGRAAAVPRAARPARLHPAALGGDRRRGAGAGHLPLLPGHGRAAAPALRPDRAARRLHDPHARDDVDFDTVGVGFDEASRSRIDERRRQRRRRDRHAATPTCSPAIYGNEAAARADMRDGWMHTGDAGYFDKARAISSSSTASRTSPMTAAATASRRNTSRTS